MKSTSWLCFCSYLKWGHVKISEKNSDLYLSLPIIIFSRFFFFNERLKNKFSIILQHCTTCRKNAFSSGCYSKSKLLTYVLHSKRLIIKSMLNCRFLGSFIWIYTLFLDTIHMCRSIRAVSCYPLLIYDSIRCSDDQPWRKKKHLSIYWGTRKCNLSDI